MMMRVITVVAALLAALAGCADGDTPPGTAEGARSERAGEAEANPAPEPRLQVPDGRLTMAVRQRSTTPVPGSAGVVTLTVDDITRGQVMASVSVEDEGRVAGPRSLSPGDSLRFSLDGQRYTLHLNTLNNALVGEDTAEFVLREVPEREVDPPPGRPPDVNGDPSEREKIERLIAHVEQLEGATFIRNNTAYGADEAADHLRRKWRFAGDRIETAEAFIEHIATRSSRTGEPYRIRLADGREVESGPYLSRVLDEME